MSLRARDPDADERKLYLIRKLFEDPPSTCDASELLTSVFASDESRGASPAPPAAMSPILPSSTNPAPVRQGATREPRDHSPPRPLAPLRSTRPISNPAPAQNDSDDDQDCSTSPPPSPHAWSLSLLNLPSEDSAELRAPSSSGSSTFEVSSDCSSLPPLIIEAEPNRHDEPEEHYARLAVKMRRFIRHVIIENRSPSSFVDRESDAEAGEDQGSLHDAAPVEHREGQVATPSSGGTIDVVGTPAGASRAASFDSPVDDNKETSPICSPVQRELEAMRSCASSVILPRFSLQGAPSRKSNLDQSPEPTIPPPQPERQTASPQSVVSVSDASFLPDVTSTPRVSRKRSTEVSVAGTAQKKPRGTDNRSTESSVARSTQKRPRRSDNRSAESSVARSTQKRPRRSDNRSAESSVARSTQKRPRRSDNRSAESSVARSTQEKPRSIDKGAAKSSVARSTQEMPRSRESATTTPRDTRAQGDTSTPIHLRPPAVFQNFFVGTPKVYKLVPCKLKSGGKP